MESTGLPEKVQKSEAAQALCTTQYPQFVIELRGEVDVKVRPG